MLKSMLEGVSVLMDKALEAKTQKATKTFIECGQAVLEQCIESLEQPRTLTNAVSQVTIQTPELPKRKVTHPEYEVRVDNKKLVQIVDKNGEEASGDLMMEIDGRVVSYSDAKGKPFTSGKFV
jgi:hypothetical protein